MYVVLTDEPVEITNIKVTKLLFIAKQKAPNLRPYDLSIITILTTNVKQEIDVYTNHAINKVSVTGLSGEPTCYVYLRLHLCRT